MPDDSMRHFAMMLIHQKCQSMCKRKAGKTSYVSIDISSDESDLEENDHIETIEEENPQISFAALDELQDFASSFADTEMQYQLATILNVRLQRRKQASIKDFFSTKYSV